MSTYKAGTVSVSNGNAIVTGSGTAWAIALVAGGVFSSAGLAVPIASVDSDTSLTLDYPWPGTTASGAAYSIALENSEAASVVEMNALIARTLVTLSLAGITPNASGTIAERDALTLAVGDKGFLFLHAEVGVAFAFYRWTGTAWDGPFTVADAVAGGGVTSLVAGTNVTIDNTNPQIPVISASGTPVQTAVHAATSKATPVDADEIALVDSAASWGLKKLTWANLKATLWTAWGALVSAGTAKTAPVDADLFAIADSASSNATKKLTWANLKATLKSNLALREVLTADRTYYVRTDGSDSNNGLANTSGGAFLTIQKAVNTVAALDLSIYNVTIQVGAGTYTGNVGFTAPWVGTGTVTLQGDNATPSNVIISTVGNAIIVNAGAILRLGGFKIQTTTSGVGIYIPGGNVTIVGKMEYGACVQPHIQLSGGRFVNTGNAYTISGSATAHIILDAFAYAQDVSSTITLTGTPAFSTAFISCSDSFIQCNANTFSGSATGVRYSATANGIIQTFGAGATYLPGGTAGTTGTQGQYL